jgi:hypothetical protein
MGRDAGIDGQIYACNERSLGGDGENSVRYVDLINELLLHRPILPKLSVDSNRLNACSIRMRSPQWSCGWRATLRAE